MREHAAQEPGYGVYAIAFLDMLGFTTAVKESDTKLSVFDRIYRALCAVRNRVLTGDDHAAIQERNDALNGLKYDVADVFPLCFTFSDSVSIARPHQAFARLLHDVAWVAGDLLACGFLVRGSVTRGKLFASRDGRSVFGPGVLTALCLEKPAQYPVVALAPDLLGDVEQYGYLVRRDPVSSIFYVDYIAHFMKRTLEQRATLRGSIDANLKDDSLCNGARAKWLWAARHFNRVFDELFDGFADAGVERIPLLE